MYARGPDTPHSSPRTPEHKGASDGDLSLTSSGTPCDHIRLATTEIVMDPVRFITLFVCVLIAYLMLVLCVPDAISSGKRVALEESPFWFVRSGPDCLYISGCGAEALDYAAQRAFYRTTYVDLIAAKAAGLAIKPRQLGHTIILDMVLGKDLTPFNTSHFGDKKPSDYLIRESDRRKCELRGHFVYFVWVGYLCNSAFRSPDDAYMHAELERSEWEGVRSGGNLAAIPVVEVIKREITDLEHVHWDYMRPKPSLFL